VAKRRPLAVEKPRNADDAQRALAQLTAAPRARRVQDEAPREPTVTTAIHVPKRTLDLLVQVAAARKVRLGGRASVSAVIASIVEAQREDLAREVAGVS
jgi:hypothetical protein